MGFFKKFLGHLGLFKDEHRDCDDDDDDDDVDDDHHNHDAHKDIHIDSKREGKTTGRGSEKSSSATVPNSSKGAKISVPTNRFISPVVSECIPGAGGIQGLQWYAEKLVMDEEGDVAHEFLSEVIAEPSASGSRNIEVEKASIRAVKLKGPVCIRNGNVYLYSNRHHS